MWLCFQLWTQGSKPPTAKSANDMEISQKTWGTGSQIITKLKDMFGEVRWLTHDYNHS